MGMKISEASATYANADRSQRITINLTDMPAMGGMMAMAGAFGGESESQSADGYEKTYVRDGQRIREKWNSRTKRGEYGIVVGHRFQVERSDERRVGKACVRTFTSRWAPYHEKKNQQRQQNEID